MTPSIRYRPHQSSPNSRDSGVPNRYRRPHQRQHDALDSESLAGCRRRAKSCEILKLFGLFTAL